MPQKPSLKNDLLPSIATLLFISVLQVPVLVLNNAGLRSLVFEVAVIALVFPMLVLLSRIKCMSSRALFVGLMVLFVSFNFLFQYTVYFTGMRATGDTAAIEQSLWSLISNTSFSNTIEGQYFRVTPSPLNHFAVHNSPILLLFALPYSVFPSMLTLILSKTLLFALTGFLAMKYVGVSSLASKTPIANLVPFALLIQTPLLLMPDLYEGVFIPPLLIWSALAFRLNNCRQFLASIGVLAMVRETTFATLFGWALIAILMRKERMYVIGPLLIGLASFVFSFFVVIPFFNNGQSSPFLSQVFPSIMALDWGKVTSYCFQLFGLWGGIPLASPILILAIPDVLLNSLLSGGFAWTTEVAGRFQMIIVVALFLGACEAVPILAEHISSKFSFPGAQRFLWITILFLSILGLFRAGPSLNQVSYRLRQDWRSDTKCIEMVSRTADPTVCDYQLCGYFAKRKYLWSSDHYLNKDARSLAVWYVIRGDDKEHYLALPDWQVTCEGDGIVVMKKWTRE